jgi:type IV pilus assembly protein PilM
LGFFSKQEVTFGLDIGFDKLKVIQLKKHGNKILIKGMNTLPIPPASVGKNSITNPETISETLKKAIKEAQPKAIDAKSIISALPESTVYTKIISLPKMNLEELIKAVPYEASELFPVPIEELYLDWTILDSPLPVKNEKKDCDILVIAAPKKLVESYKSTIEINGFKLNALETKAISSARALLLPNEKKGILILDMGAEATGILIADQGRLHFTGTVAKGGNSITQAICENYGVSTEEAELMKIDQKLSYDNDSDKQLLIKALSPIIEEISRAIRFYHNRIHAEGSISLIRITGGGSNLKLINKILSEQTGYTVETGNPLINLNEDIKKYPLDKVAPYSTAIGCALRNFTEKK